MTSIVDRRPRPLAWARARLLSDQVRRLLLDHRLDHHHIVPVPPGRSPLICTPWNGPDGSAYAIVQAGPPFARHPRSTAVLALEEARGWLEVAGLLVVGHDGPRGGRLIVARPGRHRSSRFPPGPLDHLP